MTDQAPTDNAEGAAPATEAPATAAPATEQAAPEATPATEAAKPADSGVIPEQYDFSAIEGLDFDEGGLVAFGEFARENGLSQEKAAGLLAKLAPAMAQRQQQAIEAVRAEWEGQSKADSEFGGPKLTENLAVAKRAMDQFGTPELTALLNETGLGNHPEIIRAFYRAGKAISEDSFVRGGRTSPPADPLKSWFPSMQS